MRLECFWSLTLLALGAAGGCRGGRADLPPPEALPFGLTGSGRPRAASRPSEASEGQAPPLGPLTREALREWVLALRPPLLAAAFQRYREALGRLGQAELTPNPYLMVRKEMLDGAPNTGEGITKVELAQRFELGGKRRARTAQAAAEAETLLAAFQEQVRLSLQQAQDLFFALFRLQEEWRLAVEEERIAEQLAELARSRHAAGAITTQNLRKFELASARARISAASLRMQRERASRALEGQLGLPAGHILEIQAAWLDPSSPPVQEDLEAGLHAHPRLAFAARGLVAAGLALERRNADAWPDLTLILMGMRDHFMDQDFYGLGFGLDLPLFDRGQGLREEALAGRLRASALLAAEKLLLQADLSEALTEYRRNETLLTQHDREIVPRVEETYELTEKAFQAGRTTHLDVLDSLLLLIGARRERLTYLEGRTRAAVSLEYLSGLEQFETGVTRPPAAPAPSRELGPRPPH